MPVTSNPSRAVATAAAFVYRALVAVPGLKGTEGGEEGGGWGLVVVVNRAVVQQQARIYHQ